MYIVKPIYGWCILFAVFVMFAVAVDSITQESNAKTEFESQDTKHLLLSQDEQTAALVTGISSGELRNYNMYFSSIEKYADADLHQKIENCYHNVTEYLCVPHKDNIRNPSNPQILVLGSSTHHSNYQFKLAYNEFKSDYYRYQMPCASVSTIVITPPKYTGIESYEKDFPTCKYEFGPHHIPGAWTWHIKGVPQINGTIHVLDLHASYAKYADFVN